MWRLAGQIYDDVELGFWALMTAAVIFCAALFIPKAPELRATAEATRAQEIAAENSGVCTRLGRAPRTQAHVACLDDIEAFRTRIERRVAAELYF